MGADEPVPDIVIVTERIDPRVLRELVERFFVEMVKIVVDLRREIVAVGGDLHCDAERMLLDDGSDQDDLWGANYYPGKGEADCLEFNSLINVRPARGNRGIVIEDPSIREHLRSVTIRRIGRGEGLS